MQDCITYTAICYVEMLSLQLHVIKEIHNSRCCVQMTDEWRIFGRWEKFDRQFYQRYLPLYSSKALQTGVKSDIFVESFPLDLRFSASLF